MRRAEYPKNWEEISSRVKKKAGGRCENCHRKNSPKDGYTLTVHHIDGNKMNLDENMMVALCQRCHLSWQPVLIQGQAWMFDRPDWIKKRGL